MAKISNCLKTVKALDDADVNEVLDALDGYMRDGATPQEAQRLAVQDALNNAHRDFNELDDLIRKQNSDAFDSPDILTQKSNEVNSLLKEASLKDLGATDDEINELYLSHQPEGGENKTAASSRNDKAPDTGVESNSREPQQTGATQERSDNRPTGESRSGQADSSTVRNEPKPEPEPTLRSHDRADLEAKDKQAKAPESDKAVADREADAPFTLDAQKAPEKKDTTGEMFTPDGRASEQAKSKPEPKVDSKKSKAFKSAESKIDDMELNPELTKPQVRNAAKKMLEDGVIDEGDYRNIDMILKDRDMAAEDALDDLKTSVEMNRPEPKKNGGYGTLYSNPFHLFFDPQTYIQTAKDAGFLMKKTAEVIGKVFKWGEEDSHWSVRGAKKFADMFGSNKTPAEKKAIGGAVVQLARNAFEAYGSRINSIAERTDSDSFKKMVKSLYSRADDRTGTGLGVEHKQEVEFTARQNKFAKQLDAVQAGIDKGMFKADIVMPQIAELVRNHHLIRPNGGEVHEAARAIRKFFDDTLTYMRDAGVEVGEIKDGYYPREFDIAKIIDKPDEFKKALARAYKDAGVSHNDAIEQAADTYADLTVGSDSLFQSVGAKPQANFLKSRVFGKSVDSISHPLNEFFISDPRISLPKYLQRAVKRAELSRWLRDSAQDVIDTTKNPSQELKFHIDEAQKLKNSKGDSLNNWQIMRQKMLDDGVHPSAIKEYTDYAQTIFGMKGTGENQNAAAAWLRTAVTSALLEKATLSSLGEVFMPAIRTGNILDLHRSFGTTVKSLIMKSSKDTKALTELAEDLGIISGTMNDVVMANRWSGGDVASTAQAENLNSFFKMTGLSHWTDATRLASVKIGQTYVRRLSNQISTGSGKLGRNNLVELGVPPAKVDAFTQWVKSVNDGMPTASDLKTAPPEMRELYSRTLQKFDYQTIMRPNKSTKPKWAGDGFGSLIFQLQSYNYAFYESVWKRNAKQTFEALTAKDYTMHERARLAMPLMMMSTLVAANYAIGELRDHLFGDPDREKTSKDKLMTAISRGIPIAPIDPMFNVWSGAKYNATATQIAAGAGFGMIAKTIDSGVRLGTKNAEDTNTAERAASKNVYDVFVEPAASMLFSSMYSVAPTVGKVGLAVARQAVGSGKVRDKFVNATAGEREEE